MKLTQKQADDLNTAVTYIKSQRNLSAIHSYINFMPLATITLLKILYESKDLMAVDSDYLVQDLEVILVHRFEQLSLKAMRDLTTMHKTVLGLAKQNNIDEARTVVKLMLKYKTHMGQLAVRTIKRISDDWRTFFVTTLPALKKTYT